MATGPEARRRRVLVAVLALGVLAACQQDEGARGADAADRLTAGAVRRRIHHRLP